MTAQAEVTGDADLESLFDSIVAAAFHCANKLFGLENVIFSPHMAGVTKEASDRMATTAVENILSVFDGRVIAANVVNKEVLG